MENINLDDYKLVISDIDGTLECGWESASDFTVRTFNQLTRRGLQLSLASGRNLGSVKDLATALNVQIPMVLLNGALMQTLDGRIVHNITFPADFPGMMIDIAEELDFILLFFIGNTVYNQPSEEEDKFRMRFTAVEHVIVHDWHTDFHQMDMLNKCVLRAFDDPAKFDLFQQRYQPALANEANFYRTGTHTLEIVPKGASKAVGVRLLAEQLGVDMREVIAIGDQENDVEMLREVGLGIAVGNATPSLKNVADSIIASCAEDGPAQFLLELLGNA
jgi:Cof subfamily protein (haloacid dehalogenase superfamily)